MPRASEKPTTDKGQEMTSDIRKQRETIEKKLADLRAQTRDNKVQRCQREAKEQDVNLKHAKVDHVRGIIGGAELASIESEVAAAHAAVEQARETQEVTQAAAKAEERALTRFLMENWDVLAADALAISTKAQENVEKANALIGQIPREIDRARKAWAPLVAASKLQSNIPTVELPPVSTIPLRPPGVDLDGSIIRGTDEWGRPLGDIGLNRSEKTAGLLEQANREVAEQAAKNAGIAAPDGADAEAIMDTARAMTTEELAEQKEKAKQEREANLQAAKG
jgi:hypothetical protein